MKIKFLQAFNGDSIWLSYKDNETPRNILIDGGIGKTYFEKNKKGKIQYNELYDVVNLIRDNGQKIDLLVLTHVDNDHIGGILKWFENDSQALDLVEKIWFNSGKLIKERLESNGELMYDNLLDFSFYESTNTSIKQGVKFEDFIEKKEGLWDRKLLMIGKPFHFLGLNFKILSPNPEKLKLLLGKWEKEEPEFLETGMLKNDYEMTLKEHIENDISFTEDNAVHNGSSIAFIIEYLGKNLLFLADAHPSVITNSLKNLGFSKDCPINCELVKISHHGSKSNNSKELLEMIDSNKFLISTNGEKHSHPHKRFLANLINGNRNSEIYFNYPILINQIFKEEDKVDFPEFKPLSFINNEYNI